ncbi:MAG: CotH kinase family protein [Acidiferrobacterales bacterium]|nr:CotH kinase family protein [Acidiferrobacterales bacterium]
MIVKPQPRHPLLRPPTRGKRLRQAFYLLLALATAFFAGLVSDYSSVLHRVVINILEINRDTVEHYVAGKLSEPVRIGIDLKYKDHQRLAYQRQLALERGIIETTDDSYVPAKVTHGGKTSKAKIRLKGDFPDHLDGNKWSLRVKLKGGNALMGMKQFSLQSPRRSGWMKEWIMHELLRHEGLIALRYDYVNVTINGKAMGIYALEESFDQELLAYNERRAGPILKFDESAQISSEKLGPSERISQTDVFYLADIITFNTTDTYEDETLRREFLVGRQLLSDFRSGRKPASEVFDLEKAARLFALADIVMAHHALRWKNIRFYFNPVTHRIELIAYNAYGPSFGVPMPGRLTFHAWVQQAEMGNHVAEWLGLFFADQAFQQAYFRELARLTRPGYLENVFEKIEPALTEKLKILYKDYPLLQAETKGYLSQYLRNKDIVYMVMRTKVPLKVYLSGQLPSDGNFRFTVANTLFLPVELVALECSTGGETFADIQPKHLYGKVVSDALRYFNVSVASNTSARRCFKSVRREGRNMIVGGLKLKYRVPATGAVLFAPVEVYPLEGHVTAPAPGERIFHGHVTAGMLERDDAAREVRVHRGNWTVRSDIVIPEDYVLKVDGGTTIDLKQQSSIVSYGPVVFLGSDDAPINIRSSDASGYGIAVLHASDRSILQGVIFENLAAPGKGDWHLTGAVTFYESDVEIKRSAFRHARAEDALNIIRSKFRIIGSSFSDANSDAIDLDFADGSIIASEFKSCGNDCIDTAGSEVALKEIKIDGAGDKAVSVGEKSNVSVAGIDIRRAEIGLASKDSSKIAANGVSIADGSVGLAGYQKKKAFGPSVIEVNSLQTHNLETDYLLEQLSLISVDGVSLEPNSRKLKELMYGVKYGKASAS